MNFLKHLQILRPSLFLLVIFLAFDVVSQDTESNSNGQRASSFHKPNTTSRGRGRRYGSEPKEAKGELIKTLHPLITKKSADDRNTKSSCITNQMLINHYQEFFPRQPMPNAEDDPIIKYLRDIFGVKKIPECLPECPSDEDKD